MTNKFLGSSIFNISNLLLLIGGIYYFHWYEASVAAIDGISNYLLLAILAISAFYTIYSIFHYRLPRIYAVISIMLFSFFVYGIVSLLSQNVFVIAHSGHGIKTGTYFIAVFRSFLPVFAFYVFTRRGYVTENSMIVWAIIYFVISLLVLFLTRASFLRTVNTTEVTNNVGYLFVMLLPFCTIMRRPIIKYAFLLVNLICIFVSVKRGAILSGLVAAAYIVYLDLKNRERNNRFTYLFIILVFAMLGLYLLRDYYYSSSLFQRRLEMTLEGNTSGRFGLIDEFSYYFFNETSIFQVLFGSGADATLRIGQNYAHNDWWEILIDQGLFGLSIYALFWFEFLKMWRKSRVVNNVSSILGCCFIILFLKTLFSMSYSMIVFPISMCLGYSFAQLSMNKIG